MSPDAAHFFHRKNDDGTFDSVCRHCFRTVSTQNLEADLAAKEQEHVCYRFGETRSVNLFFIPPGHEVYQLDICAAIKYHMRCPGFTLLSAGGFELGPVACTCKCHKKLTTGERMPEDKA